jgi:hypothetical protein
MRCSVTEVSRGSAVSVPKLYQCENVVKPNTTLDIARELHNAKSEVLELRAKLGQLEQERDILREGAWFYASLPTANPVHKHI